MIGPHLGARHVDGFSGDLGDGSNGARVGEVDRGRRVGDQARPGLGFDDPRRIGTDQGLGRTERDVRERSRSVDRWVALWRPIEILLYDRWPLVRARNLFQRLAVAPVALRQAVP